MNELAEVQFRVPRAAAAAVANLLVESVGAGIEQRDPDTLHSTSDEIVELVVWLPSSAVADRVVSVERLLRSLEEMGMQVEPFSWQEIARDPTDWAEAYKTHFKTCHIGHRFVVRPTWERYCPKPHELMIEIDPGMAFGTGLHPSTQLVMTCMERLVGYSDEQPTTVLDIGTGSGILSIAAARLWPQCRVLAVDNDPTALDVCRTNIRRNGLHGRIIIEEKSATDLVGRFQLVLANLSFETLSGLHPNVLHLLDDAGQIVLSGLLADQAAAITRRYCHDLAVEPIYTQEVDGWRAVMMRLHY